LARLSAGAYAPGQKLQPRFDAWTSFGPEALGRQVLDSRDVATFRWRADPALPKAMNVEAVHRTATSVPGERSQPHHAPDEAETFGRMIGMLSSVRLTSGKVVI